MTIKKPLHQVSVWLYYTHDLNVSDIFPAEYPMNVRVSKTYYANPKRFLLLSVTPNQGNKKKKKQYVVSHKVKIIVLTTA